ncbi:hypothetical protein ACLKA6_008516 [Drosophila palustris]
MIADLAIHNPAPYLHEAAVSAKKSNDKDTSIEVELLEAPEFDCDQNNNDSPSDDSDDNDQACEYLANTKEDDEFDLWGKSVAATLRNFPDAAAVRLAKSKMNIIMASLEAGELTSSIIAP